MFGGHTRQRDASRSHSRHSNLSFPKKFIFNFGIAGGQPFYVLNTRMLISIPRRNAFPCPLLSRRVRKDFYFSKLNYQLEQLSCYTFQMTLTFKQRGLETGYRDGALDMLFPNSRLIEEQTYLADARAVVIRLMVCRSRFIIEINDSAGGFCAAHQLSSYSTEIKLSLTRSISENEADISSSIIRDRFSVGDTGRPAHMQVSSDANWVPSSVEINRERWAGEGG